jgi:thymidine phosphorylase
MNDATPAAHVPQSAAKPILLKARRLGIATPDEAQVFLHRNSPVCRSEGFGAHANVLVEQGPLRIVASLYQVTSRIVASDEAGFSDTAWARLGLVEGARVSVAHAPPLETLSDVRGKVYGRRFDQTALSAIIKDVARGLYSNIQLSSFITACAARALDLDEMSALTRAMVDVGDSIDWKMSPIMDKHSVGGLPGNRTTPILVAIVAANGLTIPKTSSRAITSPSGTADTMETLAPVELDIASIRRVVGREGGCIVWGGAVRLSPTDDILIRVERALDLDSEGQLVASILSKKIAAGATHLILDMPVGPTAKVRSAEAAHLLAQSLTEVGDVFGLKMRIVLSDGNAPVGRGIGPALEARDVLAVLQRARDAPADLRLRAANLAGQILELGGAAAEGGGLERALSTIDSGAAWQKFEAICEAQGGMRVPPVAAYHHTIEAHRAGTVGVIDNRRLARLAKLAGAPEDKAAGLAMHVRLGTTIARRQPLYTIHTESPGELEYALHYARANPDIVGLAHP